MKIELKAQQLTGTTIDKVSLVKHGANRKPFAILKAEPLPEDGSLNKLADRVSKMFEPKGAPKITAVYVNKAEAKRLFPVLKAHGFRVEPEHAALLDNNVVVLKQDGYVDDGDGSLVALTDDLALGFDRVVKDFCSWHASSDFSTTLSTQTFYPSVRMAMDALMETLWACAAESKTQEAFTAGVETATKAFAKHVAGLSKVLPVEVFKMEQKLATEFETPTVASTESISKNEGAPMNNKNELREAVAGDLAGLFDVTKTETAADAAAAGSEADAAAAPVAAATTPEDEGTEEADAAAAAAAAEGTAEGAVAAAPTTPAAAAPAEAAAPVEKTGGVSTEDILKAMKETIGPIQTLLTKVAEDSAAITARLDAVEAKATEAVSKAAAAVAKADNTVVLHDTASDDMSLDGTLATRGSQSRVTKSNAPQGEAVDVWKGLFPGLDSLEAKSRGE